MELRTPTGQFLPGHQPANKGIKGIHFSPETEFKLGHTPMNELYDGATRIRKNKAGAPFYWIRISKGNWDRLHVINWVKANGPVPKGHVLVCKSKDTLNTEPSNWEVITMVENMKRNAQSRFDKSRTYERSCSRYGSDFTTNDCFVKVCDNCKEKKQHTVSCKFCNKNFTTTRNGKKYCSDTCRDKYHRFKRSEKRAEIRKQNPPKERNTDLMIDVKKVKAKKIKFCSTCRQPFECNHAAEKYCGENCRRLAANKANRECVARKKPTSEKASLNKSLLKNCTLKKSSTNHKRVESVPIEDMLELNRNAPKNDREKLQKKQIKSPDVSQMEFKVHDPKLRITRFFKTREKYDNYLNNLQTQEA